MPRPDEILHSQLVDIYDPGALSAPHIVAEFDIYRRAELVIDDLLRSGLLQKRFQAITTGGGDWTTPETATLEYYSLSVYGVRFMEAVTLKSA